MWYLLRKKIWLLGGTKRALRSAFFFSESISETRVPFAGSSIHGPFITLRMLQASLYSRSGRSLGVRRKHLQAKERGGYQMSRGLQICMLYKVLSALSLTVACCTPDQKKIWLAALTSCWNIFLSFMGSIPAYSDECIRPPQYLQVNIHTVEGGMKQFSCVTLIYLINNPKGAVGKILKWHKIQDGRYWRN